MITETVSGRSILRYRGEPVPHEVRFRATMGGLPGYLEVCAIVAYCEPCGWRTALEGDHTAADLTRLARQHAGIEDPPEGTP